MRRTALRSQVTERSGHQVRAYAAALAIVATTVGLAFLLHRLVPHANLSLLFLTAVLLVAARTGPGPSLLASLLSFLAFNYFFTRPYYTLAVADKGDLATLAFFLVIASITGNLAARMRREIRKRRDSLRQMSELFEFSRRMSSAADMESIPRELSQHLHNSLAMPVVVAVAGSKGRLEIRSRAGAAPDLPMDLFEWAWAQPGPGEQVQGGWTFFQLVGGQQNLGLAAVFGRPGGEQVDSARSLCEQAGAAMDRTRLVKDLEKARLVTETEQLRSALLSSVSHDLRTPLASIVGSSTSLLEFGDSFRPEDRRELLVTVVEESQRLDRYIQNLLDMTRIGQGGLQLRRDWVDLRDILSSALNRVQDSMKGKTVELKVPADLPLLWVHGVLVEQALVNLLDNAVRFSPPDGRVTVEARAVGPVLEVDVCDQGPGIPDSEKELIFDMFYTAKHGDRSRHQGTGLGLTICRGMVGAHGGTVEALPGPDGRGTRMRITLPLAGKPEGAGP